MAPVPRQRPQEALGRAGEQAGAEAGLGSFRPLDADTGLAAPPPGGLLPLPHPHQEEDDRQHAGHEHGNFIETELITEMVGNTSYFILHCFNPPRNPRDKASGMRRTLSSRTFWQFN